MAMNPNIVYVESDPDGYPFYIYREIRGEWVYYGKEATLRMASMRAGSGPPLPPVESPGELPVNYEV